MAEHLPVTKSNQELSSDIGTTSTLLGRGLAAIQNKQMLIADQDKRYRQARDIYDCITTFGLEDRFDPGNLPKRGMQLDLFADEPSYPPQPLIDQTYQLVDVFRQLKCLADEGYGKAYFVLAQIYVGGQGVENNHDQYELLSKKSFEWLVDHKNLNDPEIWCDLGVLYENIEQDHEQGIFWYRKAAVAEHTPSWNYLSSIYRMNGDLDLSLYWARKSAEKGNKYGQYLYGELFHYGFGVEEDIEQTIYWLTKSAEQGFLFAISQLSYIYTSNLLRLDIKQSDFWLRKAVQLGDRFSQNILAHRLKRHNDAEQAFFWFEKSAKQGFTDAQYNLGLMYESGQGVEQNFQAAIYWYQKVTTKKYVYNKITAEVEYRLGRFYEKGLGIEKDDSMAVALYRSAAEHGNSSAKERLTNLESINGI